MIKVFDGDGNTFSAFHEAVRWCEANGYSVGSTQRGAPIGLLLCDYGVSKWRNMTASQQAELDGTLTTPSGSFRDGSVTLTLKDTK